jgi:hypothetical protein
MGTAMYTPAAKVSKSPRQSGREFKRLYKATVGDQAKRELLQEWVGRADDQLGPEQVKVGAACFGF